MVFFIYDIINLLLFREATDKRNIVSCAGSFGDNESILIWSPEENKVRKREIFFKFPIASFVNYCTRFHVKRSFFEIDDNFSM